MTNAQEEHVDIREHHEVGGRTIFGFWVYIMSDCLIFASLFATYAVLQGGTFGGPSPKDIFQLPFILTETIILLTSSFTCGLAMLSAHHNKKGPLIFFLLSTLLLGLLFVGMEIYEFNQLLHEGYSWTKSAFLSAFFTLIGTHGLHVLSGCLWLVVLLTQIHRWGISHIVARRLTAFSLFWHFLDIVWIFIFTFVYLFGVAG